MIGIVRQVFSKPKWYKNAYLAPNSVALSAEACTASIMIPLMPARSITCRARIVVPPGDVTSSFNQGYRRLYRCDVTPLINESSVSRMKNKKNLSYYV